MSEEFAKTYCAICGEWREVGYSHSCSNDPECGCYSCANAATCCEDCPTCLAEWDDEYDE